MKSPNPAGRPPGLSPQSKLVQRMLENADGILDAVIAKAIEGDSASASLILARIVPALKSQAQTVTFAFDHTAPASEQAEVILAAIASGAVSPNVGRQILEAVNALSSIRATEQLEARIAALEEKRPLALHNIGASSGETGTPFRPDAASTLRSSARVLLSTREAIQCSGELIVQVVV